jgi:hypothetical protein
MYEVFLLRLLTFLCMSTTEEQFDVSYNISYFANKKAAEDIHIEPGTQVGLAD